MVVLRLNESECAAALTQAYFRGYTVRCLRFAPDYDQPVAFRVFTIVNCDAELLLSDDDDIYYWISI